MFRNTKTLTVIPSTYRSQPWHGLLQVEEFIKVKVSGWLLRQNIRVRNLLISWGPQTMLFTGLSIILHSCTVLTNIKFKVLVTWGSSTIISNRTILHFKIWKMFYAFFERLWFLSWTLGLAFIIFQDFVIKTNELNSLRLARGSSREPFRFFFSIRVIPSPFTKHTFVTEIPLRKHSDNKNTVQIHIAISKTANYISSLLDQQILPCTTLWTFLMSITVVNKETQRQILQSQPEFKVTETNPESFIL